VRDGLKLLPSFLFELLGCKLSSLREGRIAFANQQQLCTASMVLEDLRHD
jgi:hypothetical protein